MIDKEGLITARKWKRDQGGYSHKGGNCYSEEGEGGTVEIDKEELGSKSDREGKTCSGISSISTASRREGLGVFVSKSESPTPSGLSIRTSW